MRSKRSHKSSTAEHQMQTMESSADLLPWEDPRVREDVRKGYNLRLPEPYLLKLRFIAAHRQSSMHQFCLGILLPAIDEKVKELT